MRYFRLDLLTLLVGLFTFTACHDSETIGLDINEADKISGTLTDTSTVTAQTVAEDSLVSNNLQQHALGFMKSSVFGQTDASLAASITYPDSAEITFGTLPTIDSVVLVLKLGNEFYHDTTSSSAYTINVHHLKEIINPDRSVPYSSKVWNINPTVIGTKKVANFRVKDSISINFIRPGKADTVQKIAGQLRIPIDANFITTELMNPIIEGKTVKTNFQSAFKGFYITIDKSQSSGNGGIVFLDAIDKGRISRLELYYTRSTGTKKQKSVINFPVENAASSFKHDYSGSEVATGINIPNAPTVYSQALGGLRTKINFPYLGELKRLGNISVNKARLILTVEENTANPFGNPRRLILYTTDIAGQRQEIPDNDWGQISGITRAFTDYGGFFDKTKKTYTFNVTSYIQNIVTGRATNYDSYIAPVKEDIGKIRRGNNGSNLLDINQRTTDAYPSGTTAAQLALGAGSKSSSGVRMKLVITYTKLSQ